MAANMKDRGYAWVVVFGCFVISFIMAGLARAAGVLYVAIIDLYGVTREVASTPFSLRYSIRNIIGPIVGILCNRYGIRLVCMWGGVLAGIGGVLCAFAPDVFWITVCWGGIHGVGYGLCNLLHVLILGDYFDKYKGLALGLALTGDCVGTFVFPVFLEVLLAEYSVPGTFIVLGGVALNVVPAAMLLKAPANDHRRDTLQEMQSGGLTEVGEQRRRSILKGSTGHSNIAFISEVETEGSTIQTNRKHSTENGRNDSYIEARLKAFHDASEMGQSNAAFTIEAKQNIYNRSNVDGDVWPKKNDPKENLNNADYLQQMPKPDLNHSMDERTNRRYTESSGSVRAKCFETGFNSKENVNISGAVHNENEHEPHSKHYSDIIDTREHLDGPKTYDNSVSSPYCEKPTNAVVKIIRKLSVPLSPTEPSMLKQFLITNTKPMFMLITLTLASYYVLFLSVFTVIIDYADDLGIHIDLSTYLIISFSVSDLIGRLGFGIILDKKWLKVSYYAGLTTALVGLSIVAIPFNSSFYYLLGCMTTNGFVQGGNCIMYPILVEEYLHKKEGAIALGFMNCYGGCLILAVAPMIGFFRDEIGSYDGVFWTTGGICLVTGLAWLLEPCLNRMQR